MHVLKSLTEHSWFRVAQLFADNFGILFSPGVITHTIPLEIQAYFHTALQCGHSLSIYHPHFTIATQS